VNENKINLILFQEQLNSSTKNENSPKETVEPTSIDEALTLIFDVGEIGVERNSGGIFWRIDNNSDDSCCSEEGVERGNEFFDKAAAEYLAAVPIGASDGFSSFLGGRPGKEYESNVI